MLTAETLNQFFELRQQIDAEAEKLRQIWWDLDPCCRDRFHRTSLDIEEIDFDNITLNREFSISGRQDNDYFTIPCEVLFVPEEEQREAIANLIQAARAAEEEANKREQERLTQREIAEAKAVLASAGITVIDPPAPADDSSEVSES